MSVDEQKLDQEQAQVGEVEGQAAHDDMPIDAMAEIDALRAEVDNHKDQLMRTLAEAQNVRRRAELDVEKAHKFALEKFARELLPVVDSLEKTVETTQKGEGEQLVIIREGAEMTLSMLINSLKKFNVEPVDPLGAPFDPQLHEAMSMVEQPTAEPNSVIAVVQKGYTLNGRLLRPAMVVIAKGGASGKVDTKA
jgi:molecular chaperone GrpE